MTDDIADIAEGLSPLEQEWVTGWKGPGGAAFNAVAMALYHKGLLNGRCDWGLNKNGLKARAYLENRHG